MACLSLSVLAAIIRHVSANVNIVFISAALNIIAFPMLIPWSISERVWFPKTRALKLYTTRAIIGTTTLLLWAWGISLIPLVHVTSINFTAPLFTAALAVFFFREKMSGKNMLALVLGFAGALIIIRPFTDAFQVGSLIILFQAILRASVNLVIKKLTRIESYQSIVFYTTFLAAVLSVPLLALSWQEITTNDLYWLIAMGMISVIYQFSLAHAYSRADLVVLMPFDFTALIFTSIIAYMAFGQILDIWTVIGAIIIIGSSVYTASAGKVVLPSSQS